MINLFENISRKNKKMVTKLSYIDLFCGIGSFHYSFQKLGWECKMACDINESARNTYEHNYSIKPLGDVTSIEPSTIQHFDVLCAGFPCQAFSQCGHHKGFNDERGLMFFQVMKFVVFHHPPIIVLENVPALLTHDNKKTFTRIKYELEQENYIVKYKILKCSDYGIPQMRKRLFIVAVHNKYELSQDADKLFDFNRYEKHKTLSEYLGKDFKRDCAYTIRCGGRNSPITDRHNWDGYIVDGAEYRLNISDALKLQGFDSDFHLCGSISDKWKQLGNTIPTIFTKMIGENIQMYWNP